MSDHSWSSCCCTYHCCMVKSPFVLLPLNSSIEVISNERTKKMLRDICKLSLCHAFRKQNHVFVLVRIVTSIFPGFLLGKRPKSGIPDRFRPKSGTRYILKRSKGRASRAAVFRTVWLWEIIHRPFRFVSAGSTLGALDSVKATLSILA